MPEGVLLEGDRVRVRAMPLPDPLPDLRHEDVRTDLKIFLSERVRHLERDRHWAVIAMTRPGWRGWVGDGTTPPCTREPLDFHSTSNSMPAQATPPVYWARKDIDASPRGLCTGSPPHPPAPPPLSYLPVTCPSPVPPAAPIRATGGKCKACGEMFSQLRRIRA